MKTPLAVGKLKACLKELEAFSPVVLEGIKQCIEDYKRAIEVLEEHDPEYINTLKATIKRQNGVN